MSSGDFCGACSMCLFNWNCGLNMRTIQDHEAPCVEPKGLCGSGFAPFKVLDPMLLSCSGSLENSHQQRLIQFTVEGLLQRRPSWSHYLISFGHIWSGWLVGWLVVSRKKLNVIKDHHDKNG